MNKEIRPVCFQSWIATAIKKRVCTTFVEDSFRWGVSAFPESLTFRTWVLINYSTCLWRYPTHAQFTQFTCSSYRVLYWYSFCISIFSEPSNNTRKCNNTWLDTCEVSSMFFPFFRTDWKFHFGSFLMTFYTFPFPHSTYCPN